MLLALAMHNVEAVLIYVYVRFSFKSEAILRDDIKRMTADNTSNTRKEYLVFGTSIVMYIVSILVVKLDFSLFFCCFSVNTGRLFKIIWRGVVSSTVAGTMFILAMLDYCYTFGLINYLFNPQTCGSVDAVREIMIHNIVSSIQDAFTDFFSKL